MSVFAVLAETVERLDAADPECDYRVGAPSGDGWFVLGDALADPRQMDAWVATVRSELADGHADVAGSYLAAFLAVAIAGPVAGAVRRERRGWPIDLDGLVVHRHREGWLDGVAFTRPAAWVLPGDAGAGLDGVAVLADADVLREEVAAQIAAAMATAFAAVRRCAPYGTAGMWGQLADELGRGAGWDADRLGLDPADAFAEAMAIVDAVAARAPLLRARPRLRDVVWSGGVAPTVIRGTCCLYYKTEDDPDPRGEGYCGTCPLRDPDHQDELIRQWLEDTADPHQPEELP